MSYATLTTSTPRRRTAARIAGAGLVVAAAATLPLVAQPAHAAVGGCGSELGPLTITKVDASTGQPLAGATFEVAGPSFANSPFDPAGTFGEATNPSFADWSAAQDASDEARDALGDANRDLQDAAADRDEAQQALNDLINAGASPELTALYEQRSDLEVQIAAAQSDLGAAQEALELAGWDPDDEDALAAAEQAVADAQDALDALVEQAQELQTQIDALIESEDVDGAIADAQAVLDAAEAAVASAQAAYDEAAEASEAASIALMQANLDAASTSSTTTTVTTDESGEATVEGVLYSAQCAWDDGSGTLGPGSQHWAELPKPTVVEVEAPEGYVLSDETFEPTWDADSRSWLVTITNEEQPEEPPTPEEPEEPTEPDEPDEPTEPEQPGEPLANTGSDIRPGLLAGAGAAVLAGASAIAAPLIRRHRRANAAE